MKAQINNEYLQKKKARMKEKKKKTFRWIMSVIVFILFIAIVCAFALSPIFTLTDIEVSGNQHYQKEEIIQAASLIMGENAFKQMASSVEGLFHFRFKKAEKRIISGRSYVKSVAAQFVVPHKVLITVEERIPEFRLLYQDKFLILDKEAIVIDQIEQSQAVKYILIKGLTINHYELGQAIKTEQPDSINAIMKVVQIMNDLDKNDQTPILEKINEIDVTDIKSITLLVDSRIQVNLGTLQDMNYKVGFLRQIFTKNLRKTDRGLLDFTNGNSPSFLPDASNN